MAQHPWLLHYPKEVPPTYPYPKHNLAEFLIQSAAKYPARTALHFMGKEMTYSELLTCSYRFANALRKLGAKKGDRVAIMLPNCPQLVIAYYGTLLAGGIVVMTNPLYMPRELEHQLKDSGASIVVTLDLLFQRVKGVVPATEVRHVVVTSIKDYLPFPKNLLYPLKAKKDGLKREVEYGDTVHAFVKLLNASPSTSVYTEVDAENDLALLQYTGGTTGVSKGVMLSHLNITANTVQNGLWAYKRSESQERYLAALPFFHVFGLTVLMNQAVMLGGCMYLIPKFEVSQILQTIDRFKPTVFPGAPTMYIALINHPDILKYDLSSINICVSGAAPLPHEVQNKFEEITGGRLIEGYGLTESSPVTHANNIWESRKLGSIGIPFPDTFAKIVDPDSGDELPQGEIGELAVRGPQVMKGYWNRPDETAKVLKDGWLRTGDMARMDEDGFFFIMDRMKDMIIAGGFNIFPREIEEVLFEHPAIEEAAALGVPDKYRGETVKAYIVLKQGETLDAKDLEKWCRERLAAYKVPHIYEFRESLPKTIAGKVLRRKLVEEDSQQQEQVTK
ncbi:long-chain fatty acid--CoA ligase [Cohnella kolymensis]|uniref:Long-chain fatty acid--CoA ligase n=1 Tax=Cohnella kolymensis TaxID=1590652 RepID=A0ABR5A667_9BACL|nr:AMP-binding protein [Cohnella kolymensis]KIL35118.1 long-chain fatty acid--CoA ligase [Cohnella kolymensis]KIL36527.1 long-chain fatty acid--CoA ligase [Cohnella kolymensis]